MNGADGTTQYLVKNYSVFNILIMETNLNLGGSHLIFSQKQMDSDGSVFSQEEMESDGSGND